MTHPHNHRLQESLNTSGWSLKGYLLILLSFKGSRSDYHIMRQDQFCQTIWYSCSLGSHSFSDWERWTWLMVGSQQSAPYCGILWNTIWYCGMLWNTVEYYGKLYDTAECYVILLNTMAPSSLPPPQKISIHHPKMCRWWPARPLRHCGGTRRLLWRQIMPGSQMSGRIPFLRDLWPVLEKLTEHIYPYIG